jgi:hypothetical protein
MRGFYLVLILSLTFLGCSVNRWQDFSSDFDNELDIIIKDVESKQEGFYSSNLFTIIKEKNIENQVVTYSVSNENGFINSLEILPDSIPFYFNNYLVSDNRLYLHHSEIKTKSNKKIFFKIKQFGHSLDSCSFKYKYVENNIEKWSECIFNNKEANFDIHYDSVKYFFQIDDNGKLLSKYRRKEYMN